MKNLFRLLLKKIGGTCSGIKKFSEAEPTAKKATSGSNDTSIVSETNFSASVHASEVGGDDDFNDDDHSASSVDFNSLKRRKKSVYNCSICSNVLRRKRAFSKHQKP